MKALRVFNNNVVLAVDELGRDVVVMGRGVGFQIRPGADVDVDKVARRFLAADNPATVGEMLSEIPLDLMLLVEQTFSEAMRALNAPVPPSAHIAVIDHVYQAWERARAGQVIPYVLRVEVAHLHPQELALAETMVERLNEQLDPPLPKGEAIALAMHLFHSAVGSVSFEETAKQSALMAQVFDLLADALGEGFDPGSVDAARFAAHLRYFLTRARRETQVSGETGNLRAVLEAANPQAFRLAGRVRALLEMRLGIPVFDDEEVYLTIHLARMIQGMEQRH